MEGFILVAMIIGGCIGFVIAEDNDLTKWQGFRWGFFLGPLGWLILLLIGLNKRGKEISKALEFTNIYLGDIRDSNEKRDQEGT